MLYDESEFKIDKTEVHTTNRLPPLPLQDLLHSALKNSSLWEYFIGDYLIEERLFSNIIVTPLYNKNRFQLLNPFDISLISVNDLIYTDNIYLGKVIELGKDYFLIDTILTPDIEPSIEIKVVYPEATIANPRIIKLHEGIIQPEFDLILHEIYKYFDRYFPDDPDFGKILSENSITDEIQQVGLLVDYQPDYKFLQKWSSSLEPGGIRNIREEIKWKIRDLKSYSFRKKFFGSYQGYKMLFSSIYRHGSVYLTSSYGRVVVDENYSRKFRLIDIYKKNNQKYLNSNIQTFKTKIEVRLTAGSKLVELVNSIDISKIEEGYCILGTGISNYPESTYIYKKGFGSFSITNPSTFTTPLNETTIITIKSALTDNNDLNIYDFKFQLYKDGYDTEIDFLWPNNKYPYTGYLEGVKDISLFDVKYITYDSDLKYDDSKIIDGETVYIHKYDLTKPIYSDRSVFIDLTLDRILYHSNEFGTNESLCDLSWLEFFDKQVNKSKKATDIFYVGAQLSMVTDTSGFYTKRDSEYTHPDTKVKFMVFPSTFEQNNTITTIKLGTGGTGNQALFKSFSDIVSPIVFGESIYGLNNYSNPENINTDIDNQETYPDTIDLENSIFESPIGDYERYDDIGNKYMFINSIVYAQEFDKVETSYNLNIASLGSKNYIDAIPSTDIQPSASIDLKTGFIDAIQTVINLPRKKVSKGTVNISCIISPVLTGGIPSTENFQLNYIYKKESDGFFYVKIFDTEIKVPFDSTFEDSYYYLDDISEKKYLSNPFWQILTFKDEFNKESRLWEQKVRLYKHKKVITPIKTYYVLEDITDTSEAYIKFEKSLNYNVISSGLNKILNTERRTDYIDYNEGKIYINLYSNITSNSITKYGASGTIGSTEFTNYTSMDSVTPKVNIIPSKSTLNFIVNTTRDFSNRLDKKSAVVSITEAGLFNSDNKMVAYATFPPIIYNSYNHHLSINAFIKKDYIGL